MVATNLDGFSLANRRRFAKFAKLSHYTVIKDKRKHHGAVDKRSLEQQFHKSDGITFVV